MCGDAFECLDTNDVEGGGGRNSSNSAMHRQRSVSGAKPPAVLPENGGSSEFLISAYVWCLEFILIFIHMFHLN